MPSSTTRPQVIYRQQFNSQSVFVGPSPAATGHFVNRSGVINNNYDNLNGNFNLIRPIQRVNNFQYEVVLERTEIKQLGTQGNVALPIIAHPTVNLNFSYWSFGIINELRMGFYANFTDNTSGIGSGNSFYSNNFGVCCISGFITKDLTKAQSDFGYPLNYRDKRNIFVAIHNQGLDVNQPNTGQPINPALLDVIGFGNCYISRYQADGGVGRFPNVSVSYVGENLNYYVSGSGAYIPALDSRTKAEITGFNFVIPSNFEGSSLVSVLAPGDASISINSTQQPTGINVFTSTGTTGASVITNIPNLGISFPNLAVQNYTVALDLRREPLNSLTHKLPMDRKVVFPVYANLDVTVLVNKNQSGTFVDLLSKDDDYNVNLKLANPRRVGGVGCQYDFIRAKLTNINYGVSIGDNKTCNLSFLSEITPQNLSEGFFMSGTINVTSYDAIAGRLLQEDGFSILQENGSLILANNSSLIF